MDNIYVTLPPEFVAIKKYHGYFFHLKDHTVYSIKGGTLRLMPIKQPNPWSQCPTPYVTLSHKAQRVSLLIARLVEEYDVAFPKHSIIKVRKMKKEQRNDPNQVAAWFALVGKVVVKKSRKTFKSGKSTATVKGMMQHPTLDVPCFTFLEDESYVACWRVARVRDTIDSRNV